MLDPNFGTKYLCYLRVETLAAHNFTNLFKPSPDLENLQNDFSLGVLEMGPLELENLLLLGKLVRVAPGIAVSPNSWGFSHASQSHFFLSLPSHEVSLFIYSNKSFHTA